MRMIMSLIGATLVASVGAQHQSVVVEDVIATGPEAGTKITITNTVASPREASVLQRDAIISLDINTQRTNVPVELMACRHRYLRGLDTNRWAVTCYEFQVRARGDAGFVWSCWAPDFPRPHRFQILSVASGKSYASYIGDGVHLFQLVKNRPPEEMRQRFWLVPRSPGSEHPDALPLLGNSLLESCLGRSNTVPLDAVTLDFSVDQLSDAGGELRITVHGSSPQPRCTFALRSGQWRPISAAGK